MTLPSFRFGLSFRLTRYSLTSHPSPLTPRLRIHHRLVAPAAGAAAVAVLADDVHALGVGELQLAVLDALGQRRVAEQTGGATGDVLVGREAGGTGLDAHLRDVAAVAALGTDAQVEAVNVGCRQRGDGGREDAQVVELHGLTRHAQLLDAGSHLADDTETDVGRVDRAMLGHVLGQTFDVDQLLLVYAGIDLAEVLVPLNFVLVEIEFKHNV